jgi:hypothetical protein
MKITISPDCGNAPKMEYIKDFNIAFVKGDVATILGFFADDIQWRIVGGKIWNGKKEIETALKTMTNGEPVELIVGNILSHGKLCAANGEIKYFGGNVVAFCDIYTFSSHSKDAKISSLCTYAIDIKKKK